MMEAASNFPFSVYYPSLCNLFFDSLPWCTNVDVYSAGGDFLRVLEQSWLTSSSKQRYRREYPAMSGESLVYYTRAQTQSIRKETIERRSADEVVQIEWKILTMLGPPGSVFPTLTSERESSLKRLYLWDARKPPSWWYCQSSRASTTRFFCHNSKKPSWVIRKGYSNYSHEGENNLHQDQQEEIFGPIYEGFGILIAKLRPKESLSLSSQLQWFLSWCPILSRIFLCFGGRKVCDSHSG